MDLFKKRYRRATILASVPWFLQDLSTYGIGIFIPTILAAALGKEADHVRSLKDLIANDILAARGAALITTLLPDIATENPKPVFVLPVGSANVCRSWPSLLNR